MKKLTRKEQFAKNCAEFLMENDADSREYGYDAIYQNAMENPSDLWDYLWWFNAENSRGICVTYLDVV